MAVSDDQLIMDIGMDARKARLSGLSESDNPYDEVTQEVEWASWRTGFRVLDGASDIYSNVDGNVIIHSGGFNEVN